MLILIGTNIFTILQQIPKPNNKNSNALWHNEGQNPT
jgi:hypothetical protein